MTHPCQRCGVGFTPTRGMSGLCPSCREELKTRRCAHCGAPFCAPRPESPQVFCDTLCVYAARRVAARTGIGLPVRCLWLRCEHPDELIPASQGRHYHAKCDCVRQEGAPLARPRPEVGVTICKACGEEIRFTTERDRPRQYHRACYTGTHRQGRTREGELRRCTFCTEPVYVHQSKAKEVKHTFCCDDHYSKWRHQQAEARRVVVRCRECQDTFRYTETQLPSTLDRETMTFRCLACRQRVDRHLHTITCAQCNSVATKRIVNFDPKKNQFCDRAHRKAWTQAHPTHPVTVMVPCPYCWQEATAGRMDFKDAKHPLPRHRLPYAEKHFCSKSHSAKYYNKKRWQKIPCVVCGTIFQATGPGHIHCSKTCAGAARRGQPIANPRLTLATEKVHQAQTRGISDVKALARECKIGRNTVRKILRADSAMTTNGNTMSPPVGMVAPPIKQKGYGRLIPQEERTTLVVAMRAQGLTYDEIAGELQVGKTTVARTLKTMTPQL